MEPHPHCRPSHGAGSIDCFFERRPLLLDIETTGLKSDYGLVLVIGVREFTGSGKGEPVRQFIIDYESKNWVRAEKAMLRKFRRFIESRTDIITFFGDRFDVPYLQARFAAQGLPLLPKMRHLDLFHTVKRTFGYTITS